MTPHPAARRLAVCATVFTMASSFGAIGLIDAAGAVTPQSPATSAARTVRAVETEYHIALSRKTISAGTVTITAINRGTMQHGLVIDGPGERDKLIGIIKPGKSASKTLTLRKGHYEIYCPISDHKMLGMDTHLTVT